MAVMMPAVAAEGEAVRQSAKAVCKQRLDDHSTAAATQRIWLNPIPPAPTANVSSDRTSHVSLELQRREVEVQCLSDSDAAPESSRTACCPAAS